jgi:hypothetical protein
MVHDKQQRTALQANRPGRWGAWTLCTRTPLAAHRPGRAAHINFAVVVQVCQVVVRACQAADLGLLLLLVAAKARTSARMARAWQGAAAPAVLFAGVAVREVHEAGLLAEAKQLHLPTVNHLQAARAGRAAGQAHGWLGSM